MTEENDVQQEQEAVEIAEEEFENEDDENQLTDNHETTVSQQTDALDKAETENTHSTTRARSFPRKSARDDEPYEFERCTVLVMLQLMPLRDGQAPDERQVYVSARTHSYPPCWKQMGWNEVGPRLPNEIHALLEQVETELPRRAAERQALEHAEHERQAQLKTESAKRRNAKKDKPTNANQPPQKKSKKVDLNALPTLDTNTAQPQSPQTPIAAAAKTESTEPPAQMTMF